MGCIAYNQGKVEYVRVRDIKIDNASNCRIRWVGGLVGYGERPLEHCSAVGSEGNRDGSENFTFEISISSSSTSASEYTGGLAGRLNNNYARYCYVDRVSVRGRGYTGGIAGYAHQYYGTRDDEVLDDSIRRNEIFYYTQITNSRITGHYYTGGQFGTCNYITRAISMHNTVTQAESSSYGAGGVMATTGGWGLSWLYVEDCDVTTAGRTAGGISAYNDSYTQCVVKDSRVQAQTMAGGLAGVSPYTTYRCQVEGCEIKADTYAGGLIGYALSSGTSNYYIYDCVVNGGTTVTGTGAKVTGKGNYTGGLAGTMTGYMQTVVSPQTISSAIGSTVTLTYPNTVVNSIIVGGTVEGNAQTGGLIGQFDAGDRPINPDDGKPLDDIDSGYIGYINNQNYSKVLVAPVSVTGSSSVDAVYNSASTATGDGAGIGYLRVYEGIDGDVENEVKQMTKLSAKLNASNKKLTTEDQKKTYTVDDSWLADEKSYRGNNLATGGLYLRERTDDRFFDTTNRGKNAQNEITTFPLLRGQHNDLVLFAERTANIKDTPTSSYHEVTKPYLFWIYGTVDSVPYRGGDSIRSGSVVQDGILLPKAAKAASGATGISLMSTDAEIAVEPDTLTRYASGIDRLNIDIPEEICGLGLSWKIENADGDITASGDIDDLKASGSTGGPRSLSIRYDYNTYLTLSLMDGEEVYETYAIDPAQSRSCWCATRTIWWRPSSI